MSKSNDFGGSNQHVPVSEETELPGDHLVIELAGVIAACRTVRSGESIARELLSTNRGSQVFLGLVDNAERALVFDDVALEIREYPYGIDGLEQRPVGRVEVDSPRADYVRAAIGEDRIDWLHPRFRDGE